MQRMGPREARHAAVDRSGLVATIHPRRSRTLTLGVSFSRALLLFALAGTLVSFGSVSQSFAQVSDGARAAARQLLKERATTTVSAVLRPPALSSPAPPPSSGARESAGPGPEPGPPPAYVAPAEAATGDRSLSRERGPSQTGLLLGGHLGAELGEGKLPLSTSTVNTNSVAAAGLAFGLEGGLRFASHVYVGLVIDHADMQHGNLSSLNGVADASASTTLFAGTIAFVYDPDRTSFYGELAAGTRWLSLTEKTIGGQQTTTTSYNAGELAFGAGVWLPLGRSFRLVPELTLGFGAFDPPAAPSGSPGSQGHSFVMVGIAGFYNLDF